jgi:hypothetical protein
MWYHVVGYKFTDVSVKTDPSIVNSEDGDSRFFRIFGAFLPEYTASHPRIYYSL